MIPLHELDVLRKRIEDHIDKHIDSIDIDSGYLKEMVEHYLTLHYPDADFESQNGTPEPKGE